MSPLTGPNSPTSLPRRPTRVGGTCSPAGSRRAGGSRPAGQRAGGAGAGTGVEPLRAALRDLRPVRAADPTDGRAPCELRVGLRLGRRRGGGRPRRLPGGSGAFGLAPSTSPRPPPASQLLRHGSSRPHLFEPLLAIC